MKSFLNMVKILYDNPYDVVLGRCKNKKCIFLLAKDEPNAVEANILEQFLSAGIPIIGIISSVNEGNILGVRRYDYSKISELAKEAQAALALPGFMLYTLADYFINKGLQPIAVMDGSIAAERRQYVFNHLDDYYETYEMLKDEDSRKTFLGDILAETTYCLDYTIFAPEAQYMLAGFTPGKGDITIDGGCYDGAVARDYSQMGADVYAFEMDGVNYPACSEAGKEYGFYVENKGLWCGRMTQKYAVSDTSSRVSDCGNAIAEFVDIDSFAVEKRLPRVDCIKMDIEGAELEALKGAASVISRFKPKMAISAYHKPEDSWTLARYIRSLRPDYEFYWRHYPTLIAGYWKDERYINIRRSLGLGGSVQAVWEKVLYCK